MKESGFEVPARLNKTYDAESSSNGFCSLLRSLLGMISRRGRLFGALCSFVTRHPCSFDIILKVEKLKRESES